MVFTINDIAKRWGVDRRLVTEEIKKGKLKYFTIGSEKKPKYRIREDWLLAYENQNVS